MNARRLCGYVALVALTVSGLGIVTLLRIVRAARNERVEHGDVIVVFGAALWPTGPSPTLRLRTLRGIELYERGLAPLVVCSGGMSGGGSEPRAMADLMIAHGVPASAIVLDEDGITTRETFVSLRRLGAGSWRRVVAVSSPSHLYRIAEEARRHGIEALPCAMRRPSAEGMRAKLRMALWDARQYARETVAVWAYRTLASFDRRGSVTK